MLKKVCMNINTPKALNALKSSIATAVVAYSLTGCGFLSASPTPQPAQLKLLAPATGTTVKPDEIIAIQGEYAGAAIAEVQLWVNGASDSMLEVRAGDPSLTLDWLPKTTGRQILYLEAYDQNKAVVARSDAIVLMVDAPTATPVPAPTIAPEPTAEPLSSPVAMAAAVTGTTTTSATGTLTATTATTGTTPLTGTAAPVTAPTTSAVAATGSPSLTVTTDSVNLRSGPGTNYALQGQLTQGQTATVVGKSADGTWWQIEAAGTTAWVFGELVQANAAAANVPVVKAPVLPTASPTVEGAATEVPATQVAIIEFTPAPSTSTSGTLSSTVAVTDTTASTVSSTVIAEATATPVAPAEEACGPGHPFWAATLNGNTQYEFCTPVPFEFVPGASADPDEMVIRWHIFGIKSLELRIDPSGDSCGTGSTGLRQQVQFTENNFRLNRRSFPPGGYKIGLWATLNNGRVQDWGELHFCGKG